MRHLVQPIGLDYQMKQPTRITDHVTVYSDSEMCLVNTVISQLGTR